jgi:hypothetical protein
LEKKMSTDNNTPKSIVEEVKEFQAVIKTAEKAVQALVNHPSFTRMAELGAMLESFATGQPKAVVKPTGEKRTRRTPAQIEADRLKAEAEKNK